TSACRPGGSQIDEGTCKEQGKVYRTDVYTVHWLAEGECRPLQVKLQVDGAIRYHAGCFPDRGEVTLSTTYLLEPPDDTPPTPDGIVAELLVRDCAKAIAHCRN